MTALIIILILSREIVRVIILPLLARIRLEAMK
jgi:hypothetical protein